MITGIVVHTLSLVSLSVMHGCAISVFYTTLKQDVNLRNDRHSAEHGMVFRDKYLNRIVAAVISASEFE